MGTHGNYKWSHGWVIWGMWEVVSFLPSFPHSWKYRKVQRGWIRVLTSSAQIQTLELRSTEAAVVCLWKPYKGLHKINGETQSQLCTTHNMRTWSQKPPREKDLTLYTHGCVHHASKRFAFENENHCDSTVQSSHFFPQQFFRARKMEKESYIPTCSIQSGGTS